MKRSEHLQLIKRICIIEKKCGNFFSESHDCLGEIGNLNATDHIEVKANVKPVVTTFHIVPHAFKPKLEKVLKGIINFDTIEPIKKLLIR